MSTLYYRFACLSRREEERDMQSIYAHFTNIYEAIARETLESVCFSLTLHFKYSQEQGFFQ